MTVEAWVALAMGIVTTVGSVLAAVAFLSTQFTRAITRFEVVDTARSNEISRLNVAVEKIEVAVNAIAVDRERAAGLDRRVAKLEQWYDELRRGVGKITDPYHGQ